MTWVKNLGSDIVTSQIPVRIVEFGEEAARALLFSAEISRLQGEHEESNGSLGPVAVSHSPGNS